MVSEEMNAGAEGPGEVLDRIPRRPDVMTTAEVNRPTWLASTSDQL